MLTEEQKGAVRHHLKKVLASSEFARSGQIECTEPQKLTNFGGPWIGGLSWSPDSTRLAFDARPGRKSAIYTILITHPTPELLNKNSFEQRMPSWSIDGNAIYFDSDQDGSVSIWRRDLASGSTQKVGPGFSARELDAKGNLLIGRSNGTIWHVNKRGDIEHPLPNDIAADPVLAWTTHGRTLYYCYSAADGRVHIAQLEDGRTRTITTLTIHLPRTSASLDVSPDGRSLLLTSIDHSSSNVYRRIAPLPL